MEVKTRKKGRKLTDDSGVTLVGIKDVVDHTFDDSSSRSRFRDNRVAEVRAVEGSGEEHGGLGEDGVAGTGRLRKSEGLEHVGDDILRS